MADNQEKVKAEDQIKEKALTQPINRIEGLEGIDPDMLTIPRLKLVQKSSSEVDDGISPGSLVNSVTKDVIAEFKKGEGLEIEVIPVFTGKSRILFQDVDQGGGILCQSPDGKIGYGDPGGDCPTCSLAQWQRSNKGNKPPECTLFYNIFLMVRGYESPLPLVTSFGKTSFGAGKQFINLIAFKRVSPWMAYYKLSTHFKESEQGNYYVFKVKPGEETDPAEKEQGRFLYEMLRDTAFAIHEEVDEQDAPSNAGTEPETTEDGYPKEYKPDPEAGF